MWAESECLRIGPDLLKVSDDADNGSKLSGKTPKVRRVRSALSLASPVELVSS